MHDRFPATCHQRGRSMSSDRSQFRAITAALVTAVCAAGLTLLGWRSFEFDRALLGYAIALVMSLALTVYRFTIWFHRPPTMVLFQQACSMGVARSGAVSRWTNVLRRAAGYFALNRFVWKRGINRWAAHWPIMLGCVMAMAIVVPLIMGWVWFETPQGDLHSYEVHLFGLHVRTIPVDGIEAFLAFHGLVWASIPVVIGTSTALWRRSRDRGDRATQTWGNDLMPLALLLAIAATGLLMTASYSMFHGALHRPLAIVHFLVVVTTLIWLPFSKLFHIPQRSLKLASMVYEYEAGRRGQCTCTRCGNPFADKQQVQDLIRIQQMLGYKYELPASDDHYQRVCPSCRRATLVVAQSGRWSARRNESELDKSIS